MKPLIYVAGPYTHPDPVLNTRAACMVGDKLVSLGAAVIIPHLSLLWHAISPQPVERWYQRDLDVMEHCTAVVRFAGESTGADLEVKAAKALGIPVFDWTLPAPVYDFIARWHLGQTTENNPSEPR